jgi:hypothetical protein
MKRAIMSKSERVAYGIKVDTTPLAVRLSLPGMTHSGCGSPAAQCAVVITRAMDTTHLPALRISRNQPRSVSEGEQ